MADLLPEKVTGDGGPLLRSAAVSMRRQNKQGASDESRNARLVR